MKRPILKKTSGIVMILLMSTLTAVSQNAYTKLCLDAISHEKAGRLDDAAEKYSEAIRLKPEEWTGYKYRANVNLERGLYDDVIADANRALDLSPGETSLYEIRARGFYAKNMHDRAIDDFNKALPGPGSKEKGSFMTYFHRGRAYFSNKQYRDAIFDFDAAVSSSPGYWNSEPDIYIYRAQANLELGNFGVALSDIDKFLDLRPDDLKALFLQGYTRNLSGNREGARNTATKILSLDPSKEVLYSGANILSLFDIETRRAKAKRLAGEAESLLAENSSAISKSLSSMRINDAFMSLDTAWLILPGLTQEDEALRGKIREDLFKVYPLIKTKPEISEFVRRYMVQASSATGEKKYDEAIRLYTTTLSISPWVPVAYYNRSLLYELRGQFRNSISDMEQYLALAPDASDARSAKDKIYEWEGKIKDKGLSGPAYKPGVINQIESGSYSPGNYAFAMAFGGAFGAQIAKNPGLADLWTQSTNGATPDYDYSDKLPFLFSGDIEIIARPVKRIGIGAVGKLSGGIGARTKIGDVRYMMNMGTLQFGGLLRYYLLVGNGAERPDVYMQYSFGKSVLNGYYGIATMDGLVYDYSYMKQYDASDFFHNAGIGMGGKVGKHTYLTLSLDYFTTKFDKITWEVTTNTANQEDVGSSGTLINTQTGEDLNANYNGLLLKFMLGFCF